MCTRGRLVALMAVGLCVVFAGGTQAAPIVWTAGPTPITSVNDISLHGSLVHAGSWTNSQSSVVNVTVGTETIPFEKRPINTTDGEAGVTANGEHSAGDVFAAPSGFDANFGTVLDSFAYDGPNPKVLTLQSVRIGELYQIQLFTSDDRGCCGGRTQKWSDNALSGQGSETAVFTHNQSVYVTGQFVADGTSQTIYGFGVGQGQNIVNGYVLRIIPEPATLSLLGLGGLALLRRRRR